MFLVCCSVVLVFLSEVCVVAMVVLLCVCFWLVWFWVVVVSCVWVDCSDVFVVVSDCLVDVLLILVSGLFFCIFLLILM